MKEHEQRQPADDVANYLEAWSAILQNADGYTYLGLMFDPA